LRHASLLLLAALSAHAAGERTPTFNQDVAPLLYRECAPCHHPGEVAPFSLLTYEDAAKRAGQIHRVTASHYMPPWKPEPGYATFRDARHLTDAEIQLLDAWSLAGAPKGDGAPPPAPAFSDTWQGGTPDTVVRLAEAFPVPADGPDVYRCFVIPLNWSEDRWVNRVEFRPGARQVVHHALFFLDTTGKARKLDAEDPGPGYRRFSGVGFIPAGGLGGWAPGANVRQLPDGVGYFVPKGADLVIQMHYHPDGKKELDQPSLGITFMKEPPPKRFQSFAVLQPSIDIPAGAKDYVARQTFKTPIALDLLGVTPHMHWIGHSMKLWATLPDGSFQNLIYIRDWDFNWQGQYLYETPIKLPQGTTVSLEAHYDNSAGNPRNPADPPHAVTWGEQTTDEMCAAFLNYATDHPDDRKTLYRSMVSQVGLFNLLKIRRRGGEVQ
jgi:hypothetical protein